MKIKETLITYSDQHPFPKPDGNNVEMYIKKFVKDIWTTDKRQVRAFYSNLPEIASTFIEATDEMDDSQFTYQLVSTLLDTASDKDKIDCLKFAVESFIYPFIEED